jgi:hypothetical protein
MIISLGGVGGCALAESLRNLNQPAYPYDWLITSKSFILRSFNNFDNFFKFDNNYIYDKSKLLDVQKKALMLHDFEDFNMEKDKVILKYKRRFDRLNTSLTSHDKILFVRIPDNLNETIDSYYDTIFIREEETLVEWEIFIDTIQNKYETRAKILIITSNEELLKELLNNIFNNVIVRFTKNHKSPKEIISIIKEVNETIYWV